MFISAAISMPTAPVFFIRWVYCVVGVNDTHHHR
jgi:hypothetical protein